jgi:hypothetical protein
MAAYDDPSVYPKEYYNYGPTSTDKTYSGGIFGSLAGNNAQSRAPKFKLELASGPITVEAVDIRWEDRFVKFFKTANTLALAVPDQDIRTIQLVVE